MPLAINTTEARQAAIHLYNSNQQCLKSLGQLSSGSKIRETWVCDTDDTSLTTETKLMIGRTVKEFSVLEIRINALKQTANILNRMSKLVTTYDTQIKSQDDQDNCHEEFQRLLAGLNNINGLP